jgi:hypothetical protein
MKFFINCLIKHHAVKTYWGVEVLLHAFLTLAVGGGEWSASFSGHFAPGAHCMGGWVDPQSQSGRDGEEKTRHCPCRELNPGRPAHSLVCIMTELSWLPNT